MDNITKQALRELLRSLRRAFAPALPLAALILLAVAAASCWAWR